MKLSKIFGVVFGLIGSIVAAATVAVSFCSISAEPVLLETPEAAVAQVSAMMDAFCDGDYENAQACLYGVELGADREPADAVGAVIWEAFQSSMRYELVGSCYATDSGVAQNVRVTTMDLSSVTAYMEENTKALLEARALEVTDYDEIFDENDEYKEEFVNAVLLEVARSAIAAAATVETEVTVNLVYVDGQWRIIAGSDLLNAISGGITG